MLSGKERRSKPSFVNCIFYFISIFTTFHSNDIILCKDDGQCMFRVNVWISLTRPRFLTAKVLLQTITLNILVRNLHTNYTRELHGFTARSLFKLYIACQPSAFVWLETTDHWGVSYIHLYFVLLLTSDQRVMYTTINGVPQPPHVRYLIKIFNGMACKRLQQ